MTCFIISLNSFIKLNLYLKNSKQNKCEWCKNWTLKIIKIHFLVPITLLPPPTDDFIGALTLPLTGLTGSFFFYFTGYYFIASIFAFYFGSFFFSPMNILCMIQGWSANYSIVILVFGLVSRQRLITSKQASDNDFYMSDFILYFPYLISSIVS